jgi:hypothetical protein
MKQDPHQDLQDLEEEERIKKKKKAFGMGR